MDQARKEKVMIIIYRMGIMKTGFYGRDRYEN